MSVFDTATDAEYFRLAEWVECGWSGSCAAEACDEQVLPQQEIVSTETGPHHVDCVIRERLEDEHDDN